MGKKEKILMVVVILIFVALVGVVAAGFINDANNQKSENNYREENQIQEETENEVEENTVEPENVIEQNEVEENTTQIEEKPQDDQQNTRELHPQVIVKEELESNSDEVGKTDDEKAMEFAKNKWGESDDSVKFVIENRDGNKYRISVRDVATTAAVAWYTVDIETGAVEE